MRRIICALLAVILIAPETEGAVEIEDELLRETNRELSRSALNQYVPYIGDSLKESMKDNWEFISDAYRGNAEWSDVIIRAGTDIAGYTVTPVLVDGVIAFSESEMAVILKEAEIGIFCWSMGREFFAYSRGEIKYDELKERLSDTFVKEVSIMPVKVLAYLVSSAAGYSFLSPVIMIAGSFAIKRAQEWHEFQRWKNTVCLDDVRKILGDDLINALTLATPEQRYNISDPERRSNLANPERRKSIANP